MTEIRVYRDSGDLVFRTHTTRSEIRYMLKERGYAYIVTTDDYDLILNRETMLLKEVR